MREVCLVRHGLSRANDKSDAAFGTADAELLEDGVQHARVSGLLLTDEFHLDPNQPVV